MKTLFVYVPCGTEDFQQKSSVLSKILRDVDVVYHSRPNVAGGVAEHIVTVDEEIEQDLRGLMARNMWFVTTTRWPDNYVLPIYYVYVSDSESVNILENLLIPFPFYKTARPELGTDVFEYTVGTDNPKIYQSLCKLATAGLWTISKHAWTVLEQPNTWYVYFQDPESVMVTLLERAVRGRASIYRSQLGPERLEYVVTSSDPYVQRLFTIMEELGAWDISKNRRIT